MTLESGTDAAAAHAGTVTHSGPAPAPPPGPATATLVFFATGGLVIIDDPDAIAWYWATRIPPYCCDRPMLSYGPKAPDWWRCCLCHTDREVPA
jgi:hypothetical protein